jgi:hypothetical protein
MKGDRMNPPVLFFVFGIFAIAIGISIQVFERPVGATALGLPFPVFAWLAIAVGLLNLAAGFYYLYKRRSS